jgi:hypothetical protein
MRIAKFKLGKGLAIGRYRKPIPKKGEGKFCG